MRYFNRYLQPESIITPQAYMKHGLSNRTLLGMGAVIWTKDECLKLINFLHARDKYPIVLHSMEQDGNQVLWPAVRKMGFLQLLCPLHRWRCCIDLSKRLAIVDNFQFDHMLKRFGIPPRDPNKYQDGQQDAKLRGQLYMKMMTEILRRDFDDA